MFSFVLSLLTHVEQSGHDLAGLVSTEAHRVEAWSGLHQADMRHSGWLAATMVDMRGPVLASAAAWCGLFALCWSMPALTRLQSKKTVADLGVVGAQVETCDRLVAICHALVATGFGCVAWSYFGQNVCSLAPAQVVVLRMGTAITAGFILYDMATIMVCDVVHGMRPVAKDMILHHVVIGALATYVLCFEALEPMVWFFAVNLFNEISTVFLHATKFTAECGYKDTTSFMVLGAGLITTFFVGRCVLITMTLMMLGKSNLCDMPLNKYVAGSLYGLVATHWALNLYWFFKLLRIIFGRKKPPAAPEPEAARLLDEEAGESEAA